MISEEMVEGLLVLEPRAIFDSAIVGTGERFNATFVVYSRAKVIEALMGKDDLSRCEAEEWFSLNIVGGWHGDQTPAFLSEPLPRKAE